MLYIYTETLALQHTLYSGLPFSMVLLSFLAACISGQLTAWVVDVLTLWLAECLESRIADRQVR
jgi:hypothetical protein